MNAAITDRAKVLRLKAMMPPPFMLRLLLSLIRAFRARLNVTQKFDTRLMTRPLQISIVPRPRGRFISNQVQMEWEWLSAIIKIAVSPRWDTPTERKPNLLGKDEFVMFTDCKAISVRP
jgi:hypothetical protein